MTILLWCPAGGRHDGPQSPKGIAWNRAASCSTSAFLQQLSCGPIHLPLDQERSALKDACPSVKREKKEPLIHFVPGEDCVPTAGEPSTELSSWLANPTPLERSHYILGMQQEMLDLLILFHACGVGYSNKHPLTINLEATGSDICYCAARFPRKCSLKSLCSAWRKTASHARTFGKWEAFSP